MLICEDYRMPVTLPDALKLWESAPDGSRIVAGATDVLPWAREGRAGDVRVPMIVDITRVKGLCGWEYKMGRIRLGAAVPLQSFLTDSDLMAHLPFMPYCAVWFADDQIRQQATMVGNIVNASPAADCTPPALAADGLVEIARLRGGDVVKRRVAVKEFVQGPGQVDLGRGEIVSAVDCESLAGYGGSFQKVGHRRSLVISVVCAVAAVRIDRSSRRFEDVRLAIGGIGPVPIRLVEIEKALAGLPVSDDDWTNACELPGDLIASRSRRGYRRSVSAGFVEKAIRDAIADFERPSHAHLSDEARYA